MGMGCCSINCLEEQKVDFFKIYKSLNSMIKYMKSCKILILKAFLISTKSIPNLINLIERSKILDYLEKETDKNESYEQHFQSISNNYQLDTEIIFYYDYKACNNILFKKDEKENEFIIVDSYFLNLMNIKDPKKYKNIEININDYGNKKYIKFENNKWISFKEKKLGIYEFYDNYESSSNNELISNLNEIKISINAINKSKITNNINSNDTNSLSTGITFNNSNLNKKAKINVLEQNKDGFKKSSTIKEEDSRSIKESIINKKLAPILGEEKKEDLISIGDDEKSLINEEKNKNNNNIENNSKNSSFSGNLVNYKLNNDCSSYGSNIKVQKVYNENKKIIENENEPKHNNKKENSSLKKDNLSNNIKENNIQNPINNLKYKENIIYLNYNINHKNNQINNQINNSISNNETQNNSNFLQSLSFNRSINNPFQNPLNNNDNKLFLNLHNDILFQNNNFQGNNYNNNPINLNNINNNNFNSNFKINLNNINNIFNNNINNNFNNFMNNNNFKTNNFFNDNNAINNNVINNKNNNFKKNNNNKNIEAKNVDLIKKQYKQPTLIGLANLGATCYMNASLQCLSNIGPLTNYFLLHKETFLSIPKYSPEKKISKAYTDVIYNLWNEKSKEKYFSPYYFKEILGKENKLFEGISANDSKDLILFLYERIHKELNERKNNKYEEEEIPTDQTDPSIELYKCRSFFDCMNKSIISDLFYFDQANITKCLTCGKSIYNFTMYNILIFPLEKTRLYKANKQSNFLYVNIFDCFECHTQEERNIPGNTMYCKLCNSDTDFLISSKFSSFPEILTIILNRGHNLQYDVEFQVNYIIDDLEKYMINLNDNSNDGKPKERYELIALIIHLGNSGMDGHFFTYCRSPVNRKWYWYNDAMVKEVNDPLVTTKGIPYLLFYQKIKN